MTGALGGEGEHVAVGLIAKAAKGWLRKSVGAAGWQAAKDAGETGVRDAGRKVGTDAAESAGRDAEKSMAHSGEQASYEFNSVENPGPLATREYYESAKNFSSGKYDRVVTDHDTILFRGGKEGVPEGRYFTEDPPVGELQTRIDNAVEHYWLDAEGRYTSKVSGGATSVVDTGYAVFVPKGTEIFKGPVATRGGNLVGGAKDQILIPDISKLHAVDSWPLR